MRRLCLLPFAFCLSCSHPPPPFADLTAFLGTNTTPSRRATRGLAIGMGLLIVGFEFEYASTDEDSRCRRGWTIARLD